MKIVLQVKSVLAMSLILVLVFGLAGTAMAANDKTKRNRVGVENELEVQSEDPDEIEEEVEEEVETDEPDDEEEVEDGEEEGPSQGAVHGLLTIDYKVPGDGKGTMTLVAKRGSVVETFEAEIPWGLTDEEAIDYILEAFAPVVKEAFGLEVSSFKVQEYEFDAETSVTTALVLAVHGKAPVKMPKVATPENAGKLAIQDRRHKGQ